ncbi:MAG: DNA mismatch repair endonuclease MutL [Lachnospiraceae bacterium]|nr:DNA mismatch repair endonuclease MutL [Lachnospiraceae bacterium]
MPQIHVLDSTTIDKIAAGEVVERPSSVVKELVENAVDAGATAITVEIKEGGIEFIRVTDNGSGMEKEQIRMAFMRHATSKIQNAEDLIRISSLGFRGEALSSIAAVSKVEVITKTKDSLTGTRIVLEGAVEKEFSEIGAPDGTTFLVRNLFFNTPVRRKFLKMPATEGGYIADLMEHLALSRPDISFKFQVGNQLKFHTTGSGDLREVIYRIYGRDVASSLVPICVEQNGNKVEGYLGKPILVRSNRNFEIYFINGRFIRSNLVARALEEGYREYLMQHKFPLCILHITMDTRQVDVNVHPNKMDVRFSDGITFSKMLSDSVHDTLKQQEMIPDTSLEDEREAKKAEREELLKFQRTRTPEPFEVKRGSAYRVAEESHYQAEKRSLGGDTVWDKVKTVQPLSQPVQKNAGQAAGSAQESTGTGESSRQSAGESVQQSGWTVGASAQQAPGNETVYSVAEQAGGSVVQLEEDFFVELPPGKTVQAQSQEQVSAQSQEQVQQEARTQEDAPATETGAAKSEQMNFFEERIIDQRNRDRYHIIGQVFDTYWIVQFEKKMFIIDQHAAHEKVKYERLMKRFHEKQVTSQALMPPIIVSLTAQEELVYQEYQENFVNLGFEIEAFGGREYALRSVPQDLYGCSERELFLAVLDELDQGVNRGSYKVIEEKIASMSCKAAVKGNNRLSYAEAQELIDELLTLDNPYNCPHGRPTIVTMSQYELDKKFKRIV